MTTYFWIALSASVICFAGLLYHVAQLIRLGFPAEFSVPAGSQRKATVYAFTGALNPQRKESAYLHLPTYYAGILYHLGAFLALACIPYILLQRNLPNAISAILAGFLSISAACGIGMLVKRAMKRALRHLSNPDDYLSNLIVTLFQIATAVVLTAGHAKSGYYIILPILLLYIPVGKLRHLVYFFAARIHLGYFFGHRGVWPPVNKMKR